MSFSCKQPYFLPDRVYEQMSIVEHQSVDVIRIPPSLVNNAFTYPVRHHGPALMGKCF